MKRSVPLWTALLLAGCGFPYTPLALPLAYAPATNAAPAAAAYTPPRQTELVVAGQRLSTVQDIATAPSLGQSPRQGRQVSPFRSVADR